MSGFKTLDDLQEEAARRRAEREAARPALEAEAAASNVEILEGWRAEPFDHMAGLPLAERVGALEREVSALRRQIRALCAHVGTEVVGP